VDLPRSSLFDSWLVHGTNFLVADNPRPPESERPPQADIVLTNKPHITLFMRYADCVPIVYYDPAKRAVGLAHAGWRGTTQRVAAKAVQAMQQSFGTRPNDLIVGIGPSICREHYEVGRDVVEEMFASFGNVTKSLVHKTKNETTHLDLVAANKFILEECGVNQIEVSGLCTAANPDDWFSHRASGGKTGRFGALIGLSS
jgi:YfiH family protein